MQKVERSGRLITNFAHRTRANEPPDAFLNVYGNDSEFWALYTDSKTRDARSSLTYSIDGEVASLHYLGTEPQRKGIGYVLAYVVAMSVKDKGVKEIRSSLANKNSNKLAEKLGFVSKQGASANIRKTEEKIKKLEASLEKAEKASDEGQIQELGEDLERERILLRNLLKSDGLHGSPGDIADKALAGLESKGWENVL